jgi:uncharacterized repeat protein (TIGR03803 family)
MHTVRQTLTIGGTLLTALQVFIVSTSAQEASPTLTTLHGFGGSPDGANPCARVVIGPGGVLYGTTAYGGSSGNGTVFSLAPPATPGGSWTEAVLYSFRGGSDGANPIGRVAVGERGVLYGTTASGGTSAYGTVFALRPPASSSGKWTERVLHNFSGYPNDGEDPAAGVAIGPGGVLYGTTVFGGDPGGGTVFSLTPPASPGGAWTEAVLYNFTGGSSDGASPYAGVVIGSGGVLYGITENGPSDMGDGRAFSLTPPATPGGTWTETALYSFPPFASPWGDVVIGDGGVLYGTTVESGTGVQGTVFSLKPPATPGGTWTEAVLHSFTGGPDGSYPYAGVQVGHGGRLYGTTVSGGASDLGTVFSLTPPASPGGAWTEAVLYNFTGASDGYYPQGGVVIGSDVLYGTTEYGGTGLCPGSNGSSQGCGTVFSLTP